MTVDIELSKTDKLDWYYDIEYGDVFKFCDINDPTIVWIGIKVYNFDNDTDYILSFDTFELYDDIEHYDFIRIINCTLKED